MTKPESFESRYYLGEAPWWRRLWRDIRMAWENARFLCMWVLLGRKIRRGVSRAEKERRTAYLEELFGGEKK